MGIALDAVALQLPMFEVQCREGGYVQMVIRV
jgi:hypothetical protein